MRHKKNACTNEDTCRRCTSKAVERNEVRAEVEEQVTEWHDTCATCHRTYDDPIGATCSSNFHCCRDCKWKWPEGYIVETCEPCKAKNERIMDAWLGLTARGRKETP